MIEQKPPKIIVMSKEKLAVDLANILFRDRDEERNLKVENIKKVCETLDKANYDGYLILDASTRHLMDDEIEYEKLVKENIVYQAPAGRKADKFFLKIAKAFKCKFLTNDLCKEYYDEYGKEWINENRKTFMLIDGELIID